MHGLEIRWHAATFHRGFVSECSISIETGRKSNTDVVGHVFLIDLTCNAWCVVYCRDVYFHMEFMYDFSETWVWNSVRFMTFVRDEDYIDTDTDTDI